MNTGIAADEITTRVVEANGLRFTCDECGRGENVALLLHGFPEARISWRHQLGPLAAQGWRVVAPDLRGYGDSARPAERGAYRMDRLIEDAAALFDVYGARRRLLVGHDWGAAIAWMFALRQTRALDGLVIMNVPHPAVFRRVLRRPSRQWLRSWYILFFQLPLLPELAITARGAKAIEQAFTGMARNPRAFPPAVLARYRENALRPGAATAMINYYRANTDLLATLDRVATIDVPTLMIWGEHDSALGLELTTGYGDLVADFTLRRLPNASHWVQQDAPNEVNAILADWMSARHLPAAEA